MANIIYTNFFGEIAKGLLDFTATDNRCLLERNTSSYTPNKDHDFLDSFSGGGGVEISVASYARQPLASEAVNIDDANDRVELDFDNLAFGNLETGQTVKALIFYIHTGVDSTSRLIAYVDTATGLPATLGGGAFNVTIDAEGFIQLSQP